MLTADVLAAAKKRLGLVSDTSFDAMLTDYFTTAVSRFAPKVLKEVDVQTANISVDSYGEATVDLSGLSPALDDVRDVEAGGGGAWQPVDRFRRHATKLRVRDLDNSMNQLKIYGLKNYAVTATGGAGSQPGTDLPDMWLMPVLWFIMAEFYDMLAGSKSKFNTYMQANAGNAVDDMRSEAEYYEDKANAFIDEKASLYGA